MAYIVMAYTVAYIVMAGEPCIECPKGATCPFDSSHNHIGHNYVGHNYIYSYGRGTVHRVPKRRHLSVRLECAKW